MTEKKVYILLTDTGSVLTQLIKLYTKQPYNHASISFDSELKEVYSFGRKKVGNPFDGGFVREDVKSGLFKHADCAVYSLTVTEDQISQMRRFIQAIESEKEHYRYNFLGLFGFIFNKPIKRDKAFFCSQFVASVLKEGNVCNFENSLSLIAPSDLQNILELELVYEGKLKAYHNQGLAGQWYVPAHYVSAGF